MHNTCSSGAYRESFTLFDKRKLSTWTLNTYFWQIIGTFNQTTMTRQIEKRLQALYSSNDTFEQKTGITVLLYMNIRQVQ